MIKEIGVKWVHPDAFQDKKVIGEMIVELNGGTKRGATITIWHEVKDGEVEAEKKLPHVYTVTPDGKYCLMDDIHFMDYRNGQAEFKGLNDSKAVWDIMERNGSF